MPGSLEIRRFKSLAEWYAIDLRKVNVREQRPGVDSERLVSLEATLGT